MHTKNMSKQEVVRPYVLLMMVLVIVSAIVTIVTLYIPSFELRLFGNAVGTERGIEYLKDFYSILKGKSTDFFIESNVLKVIMVIMTWMMLILPLFTHVMPSLSSYDHVSRLHREMCGKRERIKIIGSSFLSAVWSGGILCAVYYLFCLYNILEYHSWDFEVVFSDQAVITTKTHWPFVVQIIIIFAAFLVHHMMLQAYRSVVEEVKCVPDETTTESLQQVNHMSGKLPRQSCNADSAGYQVIMLYFEATVINIYRYTFEVKKLTGWTMKQAAEATQNTPIVVALGVTLEKAQQIKAKLEKVGCEIEIKQQE